MIDKKILEKLYLDEKLAMHEIAETLNVSVGSVYNYIKKYDIPSRPAMNEETKAKISKSLKGRPSKQKGKKRSQETKKKISEAHKGKYIKSSLYGGHRKKRCDGYIAVYVPNHPLATKDGYVMEHILVMENHIGRYITRNEVVHHINKIRDDNRIENLKLMSFEEHAGLHMKERWEKRKENDKMGINKCVIIGRMTKDAVLAYTASQKAVAKFTLAIDRIGEGADFIPCVAFGKQGENIEKYVKKGNKLAVFGRIQTGSYDKDDGTRVYTTDVIVENAEFIEPRKESSPTEAKIADLSEEKNTVEQIPQYDALDDEIPF